MRLQIAWALAHFLWEGAVIAILLWVLLQGLRDAKARYNACAVALALMCASPVATLLWLMPHALTLRETGGRILDTALPASGGSSVSWFEANAAWLLGLWLAGALALLARAAAAWWRARRLVTRELEPMPGSVELAARRLALQLGAKRVQFRASARVASALVFGWLKPIVVLPAAALGRLTEAEIEALLAHELAHVIRGDFFVNLLQTMAECVLFYHPLVWWVSARMREERELCCDDIAVAVCRDEVLYSRALLRLEELRMEPALAATGGRLAHRIRRLLAGPESGSTSVLSAAPGLALVLLLGVSVALLAQDAPPEPPAPPALVSAPDAPPAPPSVVDPVIVPIPLVGPDGTPRMSYSGYRSESATSMPLPIYRVDPAYTKAARAAHLKGTTFLSVVITPEGVVKDIKVRKSLDRGLDEKAIEAVRKWRFEPGRKNGKPIPVRASIEMNFRLLDDPHVPPVASVPPVPAIPPAPAIAPMSPMPPMARVPPRPAAAPMPAIAPEARVSPEPALAPEPPEPPEPPAEGDALPAPPPPPSAPPSSGVRGDVNGGVRGGVIATTQADRAEMERRRGYAAERFGGANTDRGKVYMHYGPPDEIESRSNQGKGIELWRYTDTSKQKLMLEIEFQDGKQVRRSGGLAADL